MPRPEKEAYNVGYNFLKINKNNHALDSCTDIDNLIKDINAVIDEEVEVNLNIFRTTFYDNTQPCVKVIAERDKRIENLNAALEKAIERLNEYAADDYCEFEDGEIGCYGENAKILAGDWITEIRAIANGGSNE